MYKVWMVSPAFITGFALGFSLILAIGAQNAMVIRFGLMRRHVFAVVLFCAIADALLIIVGVAGGALLIADFANQHKAALFGLAALWLAGYGGLRLRGAIRGGGGICVNDTDTGGLMAALTTAALLTFGNPHVYLDTVVLVGAVSLQFDGIQKLIYGVGAALASFVFFFSLGYGASLLAPQMRRPGAWRVLDGIIAAIMFLLALRMAHEGGWVAA